MAARVAALAGHMAASASAAPAAAGSAAADDVVIVAAVRTPITKAKRGGFKDTTPDVLLRAALAGVVARAGVRGEEVQDICVGNVLQAGGGAVMARMAQLTAGIPYTTALATTNRQCSSGLQAIANVYAAIRAGVVEVGIGAGVESMSTNSMADVTPTVDWEVVRETKAAWDCTVPMGVTSDAIADKYGVTRAAQDAFAARSHARAAAAAASGAFADETVPVTTAAGEVVAGDDGIRADTTVAKLARLAPAFTEAGTTTAGNSSQVSDGAAAALLMRRAAATARGLRPLGVMRSYVVVGVPPDEMGIGPAAAIPPAVAAAGLTLDDIDVFEINEAFASQLLYCVRALGLGPDLDAGGDRVNPLGGAIALGHPLGATGARQVATLLSHLRRTGKRYGVVSMCIGTGMGAAAVFENEAGARRRRA